MQIPYLMSTITQLIYEDYSIDLPWISTLVLSRFSGSDIDADSLEWAQKNVKLNGNYSDYIDLYKTKNCEELQRALCTYSLEVERALSLALEKKQSKAKTEAEAAAEGGVTVLTTSRAHGQDNIEHSSCSPALGAYRNNVISQFLLTSSQIPYKPSPFFPKVEAPAPKNVRLTGPVRSALMVSGSHTASIVRTLEQEFVDKNISSVCGLIDEVKTMTEPSTPSAEHSAEYSVEHSAEHSAEYSPEHSVGITDIPIEHYNSYHRGETANRCMERLERSEGLGSTGGEGSLYTAVMTNPPFYDDFEEVSCPLLLSLVSVLLVFMCAHAPK